MQQLSLFSPDSLREDARGTEDLALGATPDADDRRSDGSSLFAADGARPHQDVRAVLRRVLGPKIVVKLTTNQSTMISYRERSGVLYLRLHAMFARAPTPVLRAVATFVSGDGYTQREAALLDEWIEAHRPARATKARRPARPYGEVHDLQAIFDDLNRRWFAETIQARITWGEGRSAGGRSRTSMQLGAYDKEAGEIRIHPALDQAWVPAFFVAAVVYHEMLHEKHDAPLRNGRRVVHSARFLAEERRFPDYQRARRWEAAHLDRLLAY